MKAAAGDPTGSLPLTGEGESMKAAAGDLTSSLPLTGGRGIDEGGRGGSDGFPPP